MREPPEVLEVVLNTMRGLHKDPEGRESLRRASELLWLEREGKVPSSLTQFALEYGKEGLVTAFSLYALGLWRMTKGAYLFDPTLFEELIHTPLDRIPHNTLQHLPEPSSLIIFPRPLRGPWEEEFLVHASHVGYGTVTKPYPYSVLWGLLWMHRGGEEDGVWFYMPWVIPLKGFTLEEVLNECLTEGHVRGPLLKMDPLGGSFRSLSQREKDFVRSLVNLALYLTQEKPDFGGLIPRKVPEPKKVKRERPLFDLPEEAILIPTGWRWGAAIRRSKEKLVAAKALEEASAPSLRPITPHIRRAHWHLYWVGKGSRKDPEKAVPRVKWIPATLVGRKTLERLGLGPEDLPSVVRRVLKVAKGASG